MHINYFIILKFGEIKFCFSTENTVVHVLANKQRVIDIFKDNTVINLMREITDAVSGVLIIQ